MNNPCPNKAVVGFKQLSGEPIYGRCGQTSTYGTPAYCEECEDRLHAKYPQGWRYVPGDICEHGQYVGDAHGPDYLCGECESNLAAALFTRAIKGG
jgi:uncharacterized protein YlaI